MTNEPNSIGRPTVMTPETIQLLEGAFINGASDKEAIFVAKIGSSTFYNFCQENPDFVERKEALKDMIKYRARQNIALAISEGNKNLSQWYLERKVKDEFAQRTEMTSKEGKDLIPQPSERIREIADKLNDEQRPKLL